MSVRRAEYPPPSTQAPPRMTKEDAMVQWMDAVLRLQKAQRQAWDHVAQAVSRMDKSKEIYPFGMVLQDRDFINEQVEKVDALADAWRRGR